MQRSKPVADPDEEPWRQPRAKAHNCRSDAAEASQRADSSRMKLPTNRYDEHTSERDVLLAMFEELRTIKVAVVVATVVAVPLMLLGILELLS